MRKPPAETAAAINHILERLMPVLTPLGVCMGAAAAPVFIRLRPMVAALFGIMTFSGALKLRARDLALAFRSPLPVGLYLLFARVIMPVAVFLLGALVFGGDSDTISGFVLIYAAPTAVTGFIWSSIFAGDPALPLALILLDTLLAPAVVPGTIQVLLGKAVALNMTGIIAALMFMVVVPTVIGLAVNEASGGAAPRAASKYLDPAAKVCMILVIAANSSAVASQIELQSPRFWVIVAAGIGFSALGFLVGRLAGVCGGKAGGLDAPRQRSLFFSVGLHNISVAMTLGIDYFAPAAALPSVSGVIVQQSICAILGRLFLGRRKELR